MLNAKGELIIEADEDEEGTLSEIKEAGAAEPKAPETPTVPANENAEDESSLNYRTSKGEKVKVNGETVPLSKYLAVKAKLREVRSTNNESSPNLNQQTLDEFAEESDLKPETVKKLAEMITKQAKEEAVNAAAEIVKPMVLEKSTKANQEAFEADFKKNIVSKYPELEKEMDTFKTIAFSTDFLHLKNLEAIRQKFFPNAKATEKEVKTEEIEGGSKGGEKGAESISFATLQSNPEQYAKVMADPKQRAKYYAWQDTKDQG